MIASGDLKKFSQLPFKKRLSKFASNVIRALRKRPLTQAIMAWEMIETNELTQDLERVREHIKEGAGWLVITSVGNTVKDLLKPAEDFKGWH